MKKLILLSLCFLCVSIISNAKITLPQFFSNNMVLQRGMSIRIFGTADINEKMFVTFKSITLKTTANEAGKWEVKFPAMQHGGPFVMTIKGKSDTITFSNILIGDVWLCGGQSNMEFHLFEELSAKEEIPLSENKNIRFLIVEQTMNNKEQKDIPKTSWETCNPTSVKRLTAIGYYFAKNLTKELNVPIGLIGSYWGATDIKTWMSWPLSTSVNEDFQKYAGKKLEDVFPYSADTMQKIKEAINNDEGKLNKWFLPTADKSGWKNMYVPKLWDEELKDAKGIFWFRKEVLLPSNTEGKHAKIHFGAIACGYIAYLNGIEIGANNTFSSDSSTYDVTINGGINLLALRCYSRWVSSGMNGKSKDFYLEVDGVKYSLSGDWEYKPSLFLSKMGINTPEIHTAFASLMYNGMIAPLIKYPLKGVIWYQGESNAGEAYKYRTLFPAMINDWRKKWGYRFPFYWVQLANFMAKDVEPKESTWAELREAQNLTLKLPKTGQVVITDIGDANDIHPKNKKEVGYRLAQSVLKNTYGKNIFGEGPIYKRMSIVGNKIVLIFSNTGKELMVQKSKGTVLCGFTIAGYDKKFYSATATIEGQKIIVTSKNVSNPLAVRYAWANNPEDANLVNSANILASPFRTDKWKGITEK